MANKGAIFPGHRRRVSRSFVAEVKAHSADRAMLLQECMAREIHKNILRPGLYRRSLAGDGVDGRLNRASSKIWSRRPSVAGCLSGAAPRQGRGLPTLEEGGQAGSRTDGDPALLSASALIPPLPRRALPLAISWQSRSWWCEAWGCKSAPGTWTGESRAR